MKAQIRTAINTQIEIDYEAEEGGFILHDYIDDHGEPDPTAWTVTHKLSGIAVGHYTTEYLARLALQYFSETEVGGAKFGAMPMCEAITVAPLLLPYLPNQFRTDRSVFSPSHLTPELRAKLCPLESKG